MGYKLSPLSNGDILCRYMGKNMSPLSNGDFLYRYMGKNMSPLSNGDILFRYMLPLSDDVATKRRHSLCPKESYLKRYLKLLNGEIFLPHIPKQNVAVT